jgi:hypothetical protein
VLARLQASNSPPVLRLPDVDSRLRASGARCPRFRAAAVRRAQPAGESERFGKLIRDAGIELQQ